MSRLVLKSNFRLLKSLDLSRYASLLSCFVLNPYFCLSVLSCLVSKNFQDFVSVSSCLVSRISCPDPSLSVRPKKANYEVHQKEKIRPFFQLARQANSKNVKIFEKSLFFGKILPRKQPRRHATSQIFCSKKLV